MLAVSIMKTLLLQNNSLKLFYLTNWVYVNKAFFNWIRLRKVLSLKRRSTINVFLHKYVYNSFV